MSFCKYVYESDVVTANGRPDIQTNRGSRLSAVGTQQETRLNCLSLYIAIKNSNMSETSFVPLNDVRAMKRSNSVGSGSDYGLEEDGEHNTTEYRLQATDTTGSQKISLWHDVSLVHLEPNTRNETEYHNFVCEIPKFSRYVI